jgi:hypothetical protein
VAVSLAAHDQLTVVPVDVIKGECYDLSGSKSEPGQQHQDRVVASAHSPTTVAARQQPSQLNR